MSLLGPGNASATSSFRMPRQIDSRITRFDTKYEKVLRTHTGSDKASSSSIGNKSYKGILDTPVVVSQFIQDARKSRESNNK